MLKRKLLTISLTVLVSACATNAPKLTGPVNRSVPIWNENSDVVSWHWDEYFSGQKWDQTNAESRKVAPVCTDLSTYIKLETYGRSLYKYVQYLEKELERCRARK